MVSYVLLVELENPKGLEVYRNKAQEHITPEEATGWKKKQTRLCLDDRTRQATRHDKAELNITFKKREHHDIETREHQNLLM